MKHSQSKSFQFYILLQNNSIYMLFRRIKQYTSNVFDSNSKPYKRSLNFDTIFIDVELVDFHLPSPLWYAKTAKLIMIYGPW